MSAETALRAALLAASAVTDLVGQRIRAERAEKDDIRPFIVFTRTGSEPFVTLDNALMTTLVTIELQCWADKRATADAIADAATTAIRALPPQMMAGRTSSYDPDMDLECTILTVQWWE